MKKEEDFKIFIEQLEICKNFALSNINSSIRCGFIILDNLAELLMNGLLNEFYSDEDYLKELFEPKTRTKQKMKTEKYYHEKTKALYKNYKKIKRSEKLISDISHNIRNSVFHNNIHYSSDVLKIIIKLFYRTVCNLFGYYFSENSISYLSSDGLSWIERFGLPVDKIDYVYATKIIKKHLLKNISYRLPVLKSSLAKDIVSRIDVLNNIYKNELKWNDDKMLNFF